MAVWGHELWYKAFTALLFARIDESLGKKMHCNMSETIVSQYDFKSQRLSREIKFWEEGVHKGFCRRNAHGPAEKCTASAVYFRTRGKRGKMHPKLTVEEICGFRGLFFYTHAFPRPAHISTGPRAFPRAKGIMNLLPKWF